MKSTSNSKLIQILFTAIAFTKYSNENTVAFDKFIQEAFALLFTVITIYVLNP